MQAWGLRRARCLASSVRDTVLGPVARQARAGHHPCPRRYMGQCAYLLRHPDTYASAFWSSVPRPIFYPLLAVGTLAAIVASQARAPCCSGSQRLGACCRPVHGWPGMHARHCRQRGGTAEPHPGCHCGMPGVGACAPVRVQRTHAKKPSLRCDGLPAQGAGGGTRHFSVPGCALADLCTAALLLCAQTLTSAAARAGADYGSGLHHPPAAGAGLHPARQGTPAPVLKPSTLLHRLPSPLLPARLASHVPHPVQGAALERRASH